jgi:hypothetical protein
VLNKTRAKLQILLQVFSQTNYLLKVIFAQSFNDVPNPYFVFKVKFKHYKRVLRTEVCQMSFA